MTETARFESAVEGARTALDNPERNRIVRGRPGDMPRFELLHTALSICSNKVRTVLAEKGLAYSSREMTTPTMAGIAAQGGVADNYRPGYVRLRIYGAGPARMSRLAQGHTLRTSATTEGFDACVVPTLIDNEEKKVVVDSLEICQYIDREVPEPNRLVPEDEEQAEAVLRQARIVDAVPQPGLLYAFHADDPRPDFLKKAMADIYDRKCRMLEQMIAENEDDADLVRAYRAKISREQGGKRVQRDPDFLAGIRQEFEALIRNLDEQLSRTGDPWICGRQFTLADAVWGVSLYRMHWLGHAHFWNDYPRVRDYTRLVYQRPSIWNDTIHWPAKVPPSPHVADVVKVA